MVLFSKMGQKRNCERFSGDADAARSRTVLIDLNTSKQQTAFSSLTAVKEFWRNPTCLLFYCLMSIKSLLNVSFCVCDGFFPS